MKPRLLSLFALAAWIGGALPLSAQEDTPKPPADAPPPPAEKAEKPAPEEKPESQPKPEPKATEPEAKPEVQPKPDKPDKPQPPEKPERPTPPEKADKPRHPEGAEKEKRDKPREPGDRYSNREGVKRAYLGVVIAAVHPPLAEHLGLTEGFGLQVEHVASDSPAQAAKLQTRDILLKFDDQLLTTPEHLALLVKTKKGGDLVKLTLIRKGQEQAVEVTLQEKHFPREEEPGRREWGGPYGQMPDDVRNRIDEALRRMHRGGGDDFRGDRRPGPDSFRPGPDGRPEFRRDQAEPKRPQAKPEAEDKPKKPEPPAEKKPEPPKPPVKPEPATATDKPPGVSVKPGFPVSVFAANSMVQINNGEGSVSIASRDGKHTITIKNKENETVYDGGFDPAKGAEGLPEKAQDTLKQMKLDDLKVLTPPNPEKPKAEDISSPVPPAGRPDQL